jgi:hypothetical protein
MPCRVFHAIVRGYFSLMTFRAGTVNSRNASLWCVRIARLFPEFFCIDKKTNNVKRENCIEGIPITIRISITLKTIQAGSRKSCKIRDGSSVIRKTS